MADRIDSPEHTGERAPPLVRRVGLAVGAAALLGALYLIAVRGEALIVDLSALAEKFWCF